MEKVISIFGQPENCSKACIKVLEVVIREAEKENNGQACVHLYPFLSPYMRSSTRCFSVEPELKLRAHNQLVGRLIGKGGATIKKIMEETSTTVFVSK